MAASVIEAKPKAKLKLESVSLDFAGRYNSRVRLAFRGRGGSALAEIEMSRRWAGRLTDWLLEICDHEAPGDWPDRALKRIVAKNPDCLPQAYGKSSPALQAYWRKKHPELASLD